MFYEYTCICNAYSHFQILLIFTKDTVIEIAYWTGQLQTSCCVFFISLKYLNELNVTARRFSCVESKYLPTFAAFKKCFDNFITKKNSSIVLSVECYYAARAVTVVLTSWTKTSVY